MMMGNNLGEKTMRAVMIGLSIAAASSLQGAETLRDCCWMWGHETGQVDGTNRLWKMEPAATYYHMAEGTRSFGLENLNVIRWDMPDKAFRKTLEGMKRLTFPVSANTCEAHSTYRELGDYDFAIAKEMPNVVGFELDDYFRESSTGETWAVVGGIRRKVCPTVFPYEDLAELRSRCQSFDRPLQLRLVVYDGLLENGRDIEEYRPVIDLATHVTYWVWKAKDLPRLEESFAKYRRIAPAKPTCLGIYLYDFGECREMPVELMKLQLEKGLRMWKRGEIEGLVFLCSSICNRDFKSVAYARSWMRRHGDELRDRKEKENEAAWDMGGPVTTYWAGPGYPGHPEKLTERAAKQIADCGFNVAWASTPEELDIAARHGLRCIYDVGLAGLALDDVAATAAVAKRIASVKDHPALFIYHHDDEPPVGRFVQLAKVKNWLRKQDPRHPAWVNLLPTYADNKMLGVEGEIIRAYREHVRLFDEIYCPELLSYDHYQFNVGGDTGDYFLNLGIVRQNALALDVPFLNGVQACTWWPPEGQASPAAPRVPGADELRYLAYTTLAYGAQGIYYYVYSFPGHTGSIVGLDGIPGPNYDVLKVLNREFLAIARELRPYRFVGAYFQGTNPSGTTPYCGQAVLNVGPKDAAVLVSRFDYAGSPSRFMVVNLDYRHKHDITVTAPAALECFNPRTRTWSSLKSGLLHLAGGAGVLLRFQSHTKVR